MSGLHTVSKCIWNRREKINGQDVEDVYHLAERIVEKVRIEKRPYLIQAKTYRFHEHAEGKYYLEKERVTGMWIN